MKFCRSGVLFTIICIDSKNHDFRSEPMKIESRNARQNYSKFSFSLILWDFCRGNILAFVGRPKNVLYFHFITRTISHARKILRHNFHRKLICVSLVFGWKNSLPLFAVRAFKNLKQNVVDAQFFRRK